MKKSISILLFVLVQCSLSAQVPPEWVRFFNGTDDWHDMGTSVATDDEGNVYVGGVTVKYSTNTSDYLIIKYNPAGEQLWYQTYNGAGNNEDMVTAIAVDDVGDVYLTGASDQGATDKDFVTQKYTSGGSLVWTGIYSGLGQDDTDWARDIEVGDDGYVYVTGSSAGYSSSMWTDFATIKYSASGDTIWTRRLGGSGMPNDVATELAVDLYGNVYVTGYVEADVDQRYNYATVKYRPNGDTAWVRTYNGTGSDEDRAYAIAVDDDGNVFITGASWGIYYDDYATVKYDSNGVEQWVARYNGPSNSYDKAFDLALDYGGNVYVTGYSGGTDGNNDFCTIKYNSEGGEVWVARYNGPGNLVDIALGLTRDIAGNIYVTGYSVNPPSPYISTTDLVTVKYTAGGMEQWVSRYDGPGTNDDQGTAITADPDGNVFVVGQTEYYGQQNESDVLTLKYATSIGLEEDLAIRGMSVFPNPSDEIIFISSKEKIECIDIYNMLGEKVCSRTTQYTLNNYPIDLSDLKSGIYFLRINDGIKPYQQKIIVM